jgi:hypothetical protein
VQETVNGVEYMVTSVKRSQMNKTSKEIDRAVSKIYQLYGSDLSAFMSSIRQKAETSMPVRKKAKRK